MTRTSTTPAGRAEMRRRSAAACAMVLERLPAMLREECDVRGVSLTQAAREIGYDPSTVYHWMHGRSAPTTAAAIDVLEWISRGPVTPTPTGPGDDR